MSSHRGFGGCGEDVHPALDIPSLGLSIPSWLGEGLRGAPGEPPEDSSRSRGSSSCSGASGACGSAGSVGGIRCRIWGAAPHWDDGSVPARARQSLERSPSMIPSSGALSPGRGCDSNEPRGWRRRLARLRRRSPGAPRAHGAGPGAQHPRLCGDPALINLLSSREVGMVPEEAAEMIVLE